MNDISSNTINSAGQPVGYALPIWNPPLAPSHTSMVGRFCRLEPLTPLNIEEYAADLFAANSLNKDGSQWTYLPYGPFDTLESYTNWMRQRCADSDTLFFVIIEQATQKAAGVAAYLRIDLSNGTVEVGHVNFSIRLQRTPTATEAMYLMMERIFEAGYRRYEWKCHALNAASRAAAQRFGFSFEGIFRQAVVQKGRNRDTAWFACIDHEWPALRSAFLEWLDPTNFDADGQQKKRLADLTAFALSNASRS